MAKENCTKKFLALGGRVLENKTSLAREYDVVTNENLTKGILAWGGRVLENKT